MLYIDIIDRMVLSFRILKKIIGDKIKSLSKFYLSQF